MGYKTIAFAIIIFVAVISLPIYLIHTQGRLVSTTSQGLQSLGSARLHSAKSAMAITNVSYSTASHLTRLWIKNTGSYQLSQNDTLVFLNGSLVPAGNISKSLTDDIINPGLWDPGETLLVTVDARLQQGSSYLFTVTGTYGITASVTFSPSSGVLPLQIYRNQPDPGSGIMDVGITVYNPDSRAVTVYGASDVWQLAGVVGSAYACSPAPCSANASTGEVIWPGSESVPAGGYQVFSYNLTLNSSLSGSGSATFSGSTNTSLDLQATSAPVAFTPGAASVSMLIAGGGYGYSAAIGKLDGTVNTTFTVELSELSGSTQLKVGQEAITRIPSGILGVGTTDSGVTVNSTDIAYALSNPLKGASRTYTFWAILPDYDAAVVWNTTFSGTDTSGTAHDDVFPLLTASQGYPPTIGQPELNATSASVGSAILLSQSINDTSGVASATFSVNGTALAASPLGSVFSAAYMCGAAGTYSWSNTTATDSYGNTATTKTDAPLAFTCT